MSPSAWRARGGRLQTKRLQTKRLQTKRLQAKRLQAKRLQVKRFQVKRFQVKQRQVKRLRASRLRVEQLLVKHLPASPINTVTVASKSRRFPASCRSSWRIWHGSGQGRSEAVCPSPSSRSTMQPAR